MFAAHACMSEGTHTQKKIRKGKTLTTISAENHAYDWSIKSKINNMSLRKERKEEERSLQNQKQRPCNLARSEIDIAAPSPCFNTMAFQK